MNESNACVHVLSPGVLTTVQDGGRPGWLARGVPAAGAQDALALRVANLLVGNRPAPPVNAQGDPGHAGLECTLIGPSLQFSTDTVVAVCGGAVDVTCDGQSRPQYESFTVPAGATLKVGAIRQGMRAYIAVSGGFEAPLFLGSRSTHLALKVGGWQGRALTAGDRIGLGECRGTPGRKAAAALRFQDQQEPTLRMLPGPERHLFDPQSVADFMAASWKLLPASNRMGFRFSGPRLRFQSIRSVELDRAAGANPSNIVDDLLPMGAVQCPDGAAAIVMGVEHPTAGGYARIGTVITPDLAVLGQVRPGQQVRFADIGIDEALIVADAIERALEQPYA